MTFWQVSVPLMLLGLGLPFFFLPITAHADLAGQVDRSGEATRSLLGSGMDMDSVRSVLDGMTQGQSVMLATNEIMATCALAFCVASALI
jgi:DHA2 family multidrug resistance protein